VDHGEHPSQRDDDDEHEHEEWLEAQLGRLEERARRLEAAIVALTRREAEEAEGVNEPRRWRDGILACKKEGLVDELRALLTDEMHILGDRPSHWATLQLIDPEAYRVQRERHEAGWSRLVRSAAAAELEGRRMGAPSLASQADLPLSTVPVWRQRPGFRDAVERTKEALRLAKERRQWVEERRRRPRSPDAEPAQDLSQKSCRLCRCVAKRESAAITVA
jgi:hypothetical protein